MPRSAAATLLASHAAALGIGFAIFQPTRPSSEEAASPRTKSSDRPAQEVRRVPTADLLEAYRNTDFWRAAQARRNKPQEPTDTPSASSYVPPEKRADEVEDIAAALDEQLAGVNSNGGYDYQFAKALIRRWLGEDPEACMQWIGGMRMEVGWGDPFSALAETLPAVELLDLMGEGWLTRNRRYALSAISEEVGAQAPESLPDILPRLRKAERKSFLSNAIQKARAEDAAFWLEFAIEQEPDILSKLGDRWFRTVTKDWQWKDGELVAKRPVHGFTTSLEDARKVAEMARGTSVEEEFTRLLQQAEISSERERLLTLATREPNEAVEQLLALETASGRSAEEARTSVAQLVDERFEKHAEAWRRSEWELTLQSSVLGEQPLETAVLDRFEQIRTELPETFQAPLLQQTLRDAMRIDPDAAFRLATQAEMESVAIDSACELMPGSSTPDSVRAEIVLQLDQSGLWESDRNLRRWVLEFGSTYLKEDPTMAERWLTQLSPPLAGEIQGSTR